MVVAALLVAVAVNDTAKSKMAEGNSMNGINIAFSACPIKQSHSIWFYISMGVK